MRKIQVLAFVGLAVGLFSASLVLASPRDSKVGDVRAVFATQGTTLRGSPSAVGAPVATLPSGTRVRVDEVQFPWLRVTVVGAPAAAQSGWVRAVETVEADALAPPAAPRLAAAPGGGGVTERDVSAAGRQLSASTERGYRGTKNLEAAYRMVDEMERLTREMNPAESIAFIAEGMLGRVGRSYARPALLPPSPPPRSGGNDAVREGVGRAGEAIGGLLGGALGGRGGERQGADAARAFAQSSVAYAQQLKQAFTPDQEYYLGRAVAANVIAKYGVDRDANRRAYVRAVGDAIVRVSKEVPPNFGGYHFEVLDSDEVNGVSGPGGYVFVTRGAVMACQTEDELAGILAHEIAHVALKHGENVVRQGRAMQSRLEILTNTASAATEAQWAQQLVQFMDGVVGDMARTATETGYGRNLEFVADGHGSTILWDAYYDHGALKELLQRLPAHQGGHAGTHAAPAIRAGTVANATARTPPFNDPAAREARLQRFRARCR
jgi:Zn-dependent protease with chaperone function